jgi:hypothetical protein
VLCCAVLCCAVLCCAVLCCDVLCCAVLCCVVSAVLVWFLGMVGTGKAVQCWDWLMGGHDRHGDVGKSMVWLDCEFHEVMSCCFRFHVIVKNIENA